MPATAFRVRPEIKDAVLEELRRAGSLRPTELLQRLQEQYSDSAIKDAVLELLNEDAVEISPEQEIRILQVA